MSERKPIPRPEFVSPSGRALRIDDERLVIGLEPLAVCTEDRNYGFCVWDFDECDVDAPDREATLLGTGPTRAAAWRTAHLFLTDNRCTCGACWRHRPKG